MIESKLNFGISEKSYKLIEESLAKYPEIEKVVIFGSRALGNEKSGSDIDIAIFGKKLTDEILSSIRVLLNEKLNIPYFVDVVDYNSIKNQQLKEHIDSGGKIFWVKNELR